MGPLVAALVPMIPGVLKSITDMLKKPDPKAEFDTAIKEAQRKAQTAEQKAAVESARLQGLKYMREWYAQQDANNPPASVIKWGQAGVDNFRRNVEQAKQEMNGVTTGFSTTTGADTQYNFGYKPGEAGGPVTDTATWTAGPKSWSTAHWVIVAAVLFLFTPLKKIFK